MKKLVFCLAVHFAGLAAAQCPDFLQCPTTSQIVCDYSNNDAQFWKAAPFTWNPVLMLSDLPEADADLSIAILDSCGGQNLTVEYTLFLDLDGNDTAETVLRSNSVLPGKVLFDNISSPNYAQGDTITFDARASLPDSLKYRFGLQLTSSSDTLIAQLKWVSGIQSLNYNAPQLPMGNHRIRWRIEQGGVERFCEYGFEVKDCAPPVVKCVAPFTVNIWTGGKIQLWASDFFSYQLNNILDNITPNNLMRIAVRKQSSNGSGFPFDSNGNPVTSVTFTCLEAWVNPVYHLVELWAIDKAGNTDSCTVLIGVKDDLSFCNFDPSVLNICALTWANQGIENVSCKVTGTSPFVPPFTYFRNTSEIGCASVIGYIPCTADLTVYPARNDNLRNGVTTYDLVLISKHILALEPLTSPYKIIAADVNNSGSVTSLDIVELRKLILGIVDTLPNNHSWRFVDEGFIFPNSLNPFQTHIPDTTHLEFECFVTQTEFIGIKVGDVNGSAIPNASTPPPAESRSPAFLTFPDQHLEAGKTYEIPLLATEDADWPGWQLGLSFDPELLEIEAVESPGFPGFDSNNWAQPRPGLLALSWSDARSVQLPKGADLLRLRVSARASGALSRGIQASTGALRPEAYDLEGGAHALQLVFAENDAAETARVFAPQPNPTHGGAMLPVQLLQAEDLRLELRDLSGKLLWCNELHMEKGSHTLEIPALAMPRAGVYVWQVKAGALEQTGKMVRL